MKLEIPVDDRIIDWDEHYRKVGESVPNRDPTFKLEGPWKEYAYNEGPLIVCRVDTLYIRNNLNPTFPMQAMWYQYEFMPRNEMWVSKDWKQNLHKTAFHTESQLEEAIQHNAQFKDPNFRLDIPGKKFIEKRNGLDIYDFDQEWLNINVDRTFHHGGHGLVHPYIPMGEGWISTHHHNCKCKNVREDRKVSERYRKSAINHEIDEYYDMSTGMIYWKAHNRALEKERKSGLLTDPYTENYDPL